MPVPIRVRAGALLEVILTSGYPTQLMLGLVFLGFGLHPYAADGRLAMPYVLALWLADAVLTVGLVVLFLRARGEGVGELLLGARGLRVREMAIGVLLIPGLFAVVAGVLGAIRLLWPGLHNVATSPFEALIRTPHDAALLALVAGVSGGIKEEVQRAFILRRFEQHLGGAVAGLLLFSGVFGAGHFIQGWDVGVATTLLGIIWGVVFLWRRSIVAGAVSHAGFNVAQIVQYLVFGS
jgi:membrane protease YdiL (CAAX protease family)